MEDAVVALCSVVLVLALLWLAASTLVCLRDVAMGRLESLAGGGLLRPRVVRAAVLAGVGLLAASGLQSAHADRGTDRSRGPAGPHLPQAVGGLPVPDRPYGGVRTHRVRVGESLWTIAADIQPATQGVATTARTWPRIYRLNRDRIGPDPDLIRPGTILRLPPHPAARPIPTTGATR